MPAKPRTIDDMRKAKQAKIDRLVKAIRSRKVGNDDEAARLLGVTRQWASELRRLACEQGHRIVRDHGRRLTIIE